MYFLSWIIVGLVTGWLTRKLLKGGGYGAIVDLVMCLAGAVAGGFIVLVASFPGHGGARVFDPGGDSWCCNPERVHWLCERQKAVRLTSQSLGDL